LSLRDILFIVNATAKLNVTPSEFSGNLTKNYQANSRRLLRSQDIFGTNTFYKYEAPKEPGKIWDKLLPISWILPQKQKTARY